MNTILKVILFLAVSNLACGVPTWAMDTAPRKSARQKTNPVKIDEANHRVHHILTTTNWERIFSGSPAVWHEKPELKSEMACGAEIISAGGIVTGSYDSGTMVHAEMQALSHYLEAHGSLDGIEIINISSPPCHSCAFILHSLNLEGKVRHDGGRFKAATSSWHLPENLAPLLLHEEGRFWTNIKGSYQGSGLGDEAILEKVVHVITTGSPL